MRQRPTLGPVPAVLLMVLVCASPAGAQASAQTDGVAGLLTALEQAIAAGDPAATRALLGPAFSAEEADWFIRDVVPRGLTRLVLQERDRVVRGDLGPGRYRSLVEIFTEVGLRARLVTWRLEIAGTAGPDGALAWHIVEAERLTSIDGLFQLQVDTERAYAARDVSVRSEDLLLHLPLGTVFQVRTDEGVTALVLLGDGEMIFSPAPAAERGQVRIFSGDEVLRTPFRSAFVRLNPVDFSARVNGQLTPAPADPRDARRAREVFDEFAEQSFSLDLSDLSERTWSLQPSPGDFLAEVQTRRLGSLTYTKSAADAEDITLFDRQRKRNISVYASAARLASRGRFYNEDDLVDINILHTYLDVTFAPDRDWVQGRARLRLRVRRPLTTLTLRLADPLVVHSVRSDELGRLLHVRVRGQNAVLVSLPRGVTTDTELSLDIQYSGTLEPQAPEREALAVQRWLFGDLPELPPPGTALYSNRNYWYPQSPVSDYGTATLYLTVPDGHQVVASGEPRGVTLVPAGSDGENGEVARQYQFVATQPVRYLSCVITTLVSADSLSLTLGSLSAPEPVTDGNGGEAEHRWRGSGVHYDTLEIDVQAHPRQAGRGRELAPQAADMVRFYGSLLRDIPYPTFTLALIENDLPGGHSPAYFALLYQAPASGPLPWRNDPVHFESYPPFFMAHEIAHQWWGQAVGWKNYHEQWLSEGMAQYFASLYAEHDRGEGTFHGILRQKRRWAMDRSDQGPIYLGYRLGHIRNDGRVFRAIAYNKAAMVLHMLRRMVGDEAFFDALREFYREFRFRKAGTDDLQRIVEEITGRRLGRFFERWIFEDGLPRINYAHGVVTSGAGPAELLVRFEQTGDIYDLAVTVTVNYRDGRREDLVAVLDERISELRVPLDGTVRGVAVNRDDGALGHFRRSSMPPAPQ